MSDRRKGGGLDYTPQAFPGARAPDGPAPDLGDKLAKMGLVEGTEATDSQVHVSVDVNAGTSRGAKKRAGLDYTPQAFPGARAPDGPAPDLQARLAQMGLAEQTAAPAVRADVRHDPIAAVTPPRRAESTAPRIEPQPAPAVRREPVAASSPPIYSSSPASVPAESSRRPATPSPPIAPAMPSASRPAERAVDPAPAPRRPERAAPPSVSVTPQPQPGSVAPPPASAPVASASAPSPPSPAAPTLPPVPKEAVPRPLPVAATSAALTVSREPKAITKAASQAIRRGEILRALPDKEDRVRISLRLVASVDQKLDDLAHLRGLDRNTAISVAIAQDWIACFGLHARQEVR